MITKVTGLAAVLQSYGIETDIPKISEKLKPEPGFTFEKQIVMFGNLYDMNPDDDSETTSDPSNGQSRVQLDTLAGNWRRGGRVSWKEGGGTDGEDEEDEEDEEEDEGDNVDTSTYYDAKSKPLASSPTKKNLYQ